VTILGALRNAYGQHEVDEVGGIADLHPSVRAPRDISVLRADELPAEAESIGA
jgi:hypothetical protein